MNILHDKEKKLLSIQFNLQINLFRIDLPELDTDGASGPKRCKDNQPQRLKHPCGIS